MWKTKNAKYKETISLQISCRGISIHWVCHEDQIAHEEVHIRSSNGPRFWARRDEMASCHLANSIFARSSLVDDWRLSFQPPIYVSNCWQSARKENEHLKKCQGSRGFAGFCRNVSGETLQPGHIISTTIVFVNKALAISNAKKLLVFSKQESFFHS